MDGLKWGEFVCLQYKIMEQQQAPPSSTVGSLLLRFLRDETEAAREVLELITKHAAQRATYLQAFNILFNNTNAHSRQRRDVAAIARLIADSDIFVILETSVKEDALGGTSVKEKSLTIQTTKLIANICNQNPHFIDNILTVQPTIISTLCQLYSFAETTPADADGLFAVLNFLHNISLKETSLRTEMVAPCLQAFLQNLLIDSKFCNFISHKKFQNFVSSLFKFHANVPVVAFGVYKAIIKAVRAVNHEYKRLAAIYSNFSQNDITPEERQNLKGLASLADRKLIAIMRLFQKARSHIFAKFDALSFTPILRVFVKIAVMRPVAMLNQPIENRLLIDNISQLMNFIQLFKKQIIANGLLSEQDKSKKEGERQQNVELQEIQEEEVLPPVQEENSLPNLTPQQISRFKNELKSFEEITEVTRHFSGTYFKITTSTIDTLAYNFQWQEKYLSSSDPQVVQAMKSYSFLNEILTVRLERILSMMMKLSSRQELKQNPYYSQIVTMLLKLMPYYFQRAATDETMMIVEEIKKMEDITNQSQGSAMRFIMEAIDEDLVKGFVQARRLEKSSVFSAIYEVIVKYVNYLTDEGAILKDVMLNFIHVFIAYIRKHYMVPLSRQNSLTLRQVMAMRFALLLVAEILGGNIHSAPGRQAKNRIKLYRYCKLLEKNGIEDGAFSLLGDIINNLQKHGVKRTQGLLDTQSNRQQMVKTVCTRVMFSRIRTHVNYFTQANITHEDTFQGSATIEFIQGLFQGYQAYIKVMNAFIMQICPSLNHDKCRQPIRDEIIQIVGTRTLSYLVFVSHNLTEEGMEEEIKMLKDNRVKVDETALQLGEWMLKNAHKKLHKVPLLMKKVLHFDKIELVVKIRQQQERILQESLIRQEQLAHTADFIRKISVQLNQTSYNLLTQKLDLQMKLPKAKPMLQESQQLQISGEVEKVANLLMMLTEILKILVSEQELQDPRLYVSPNYIYSVLSMITKIMLTYDAEQHFPLQANDLFQYSLWMIEEYLLYYNEIRRVRQLKVQKKKMMKSVTRKIKNKMRRAGKRMRTELSEDEIEDHGENDNGTPSQDNIRIQDPDHSKQDEDEEGNPNPQLNPKKRRRRKRNKKGKKKGRSTPKEEPKTLTKDRSKTNLLAQSQVNTESKHKLQSKGQQGILQKCIKQYVGFMTSFLGNCTVPIASNDTLAMLINFIIRHMKWRKSQPSSSKVYVQLLLSELTPHLLKIKTINNTVPGFHFPLCTLAYQLFDESHVMVNYQISIKRYLFQQAQNGDVMLAQFVKMHRQNFKQISPSLANFLEIVVVEEGLNVRKPFTKANCEELLQQKAKKCLVQLRQGQDFHLLSSRPPENPSKRKPSSGGNNQQHQLRLLKVSDYTPQGELLSFIQNLITYSIRVLLVEVDRYIANDLLQPQKYETIMEAFTDRAVLQVLQYMVRESPALGPFIARFKCRKILQTQMASQNLKNREKVAAYVGRALNGNGQHAQTMQEVGYLSVLIRFFSPLVVNAISGLVFQLCLDSTPLVQLGETGKEGRSKGGHVSFGSVIRLKVKEEIQNILFDSTQLEWLFRKLCLLNLVTVLMNIREMARLFIDFNFIPKLYKQFQAIKQAMTSQIVQERLPGNHITKVITPFYLTPISLLQELNIAFHYHKKLNKVPPKIVISSLLSHESINPQLVPADALKRYKFKLDWPFHQVRDLLNAPDNNGELLESMERQGDHQDEDLYADGEGSFDSQENSNESEDSLDSQNSSFMNYDDLQMPMDDDEMESYLSMQPNEQLLNEEWDYSEDQQEIDQHYPSEDDAVLEIEPNDEGEEIEQAEEEERGEMDGGEGSQQQQLQDEEEQGESQDNLHHVDDEQIEAYLQQQGISHSQPSPSLIHQLNELPSSHSSFNFLIPKSPLGDINEQDYYAEIQAMLNFDKVQSIPRISKAEKRQVHLLRFFLQLAIMPSRQLYNIQNPRRKSKHQQKEEQQVKNNLNLMLLFAKDRHLRLSEAVEYNQIYRYDHFHKDFPTTAQRLKKIFSDQMELIRRNLPPARRNGFIGRDGLLEIMPGWTINQVVNQVQVPSPLQSEEDPQEQEGREIEEEGESMLEINSEESDEQERGGQAMDLEDAPMTHEQQMAQIQELLRAGNLGLTPQQFMRLDAETRNDIILNITHLQHNPPQQNPNPQQSNQSPANSPVSFVQPEYQNEIQIPMLQLGQQREDPLAEGRVIEALSDQRDPSDELQGPEPQLQEMQAEEGAQEEPREGGQGQPVDEVYRKMSLQHTKKVSKDVMQALNKDGKNNSKFHEISYSELQDLIKIFYLTNDEEHLKYPYPIIETLCINTVSLKRIVSIMIAILHEVPPSVDQKQELQVFTSVITKILHMLTHLTKNYSVSMALLRVNNDLSLKQASKAKPQQAFLSSFQLLILLLKKHLISESSTVLGFLIGVLDNITMHHFYKNVHKIVQKAGEEDERVRISQDSVYLLGQLLQSDYVKDNLPLVSKIIMRLSVQEQNLKNFIGYLEHLVRQLTDQALAEVQSATREKQEEKGQQKEKDGKGALKIANLMSIFYEMVKAFQTYPTTLDRHDQVMFSLRRIVQYEKLQELCQLAMRGVFEGDGKANTKGGQAIDCFFVLYEIAGITGSTKKKKQEDNQHNHIAELGEIDLAEHQRRIAGEEQEIWLGGFNLSKLWKEAVSHPTFKHYVNANISKKISQASRRGSAFELPIIKIAASTSHLLSFDNKYALFKSQLKRLRGRNKEETIHISLNREDVFETSFEQLMTRSGEKLRGKLKIQFQGEEGEDAGGVTREWFQLLSREMFNPNYGLFRSGSAGHTYHPSPTSYFNERHLDYFKFIGRIAGKALYDGYLLDAYFTPAFYKHILALPITYRDMQQQDYQYFKSLTWILENSPIEDYLELTFTYDCDNFGEIQTKELIPGGSGIIVSESNKLQYVQLIAYARMATSIKLQLQAFLTGLHQLVPHRLLKIFSEKELEIMISGRPTIDIEDLRRNTELVNYLRNDPIIVWLFEVLQAFDMELRTAFIQFVTGSSRVPVEGFKDLRGMNGVQRFNIHREFQEERLPRAHTCFNQLDLPNYKSKEILIEKLMYAITEGKQGFGMI